MADAVWVIKRYREAIEEVALEWCTDQGLTAKMPRWKKRVIEESRKRARQKK